MTGRKELEGLFGNEKGYHGTRQRPPPDREFAPKRDAVAEVFESIDPTKGLNETLSALDQSLAEHE